MASTAMIVGGVVIGVVILGGIAYYVGQSNANAMNAQMQAQQNITPNNMNPSTSNIISGVLSGLITGIGNVARNDSSSNSSRTPPTNGGSGVMARDGTWLPYGELGTFGTPVPYRA